MNPARVRVLAFLFKKPGMSDDAFYKHWQHVHGPLFANLQVVRSNILKYEQHHNTASLDPHIPSAPLALPYHGVALFEAESYDKINQVFLSDEYTTVVLPDESNFILREKTMFVAGPILTYIDQ